MKKKTLSLKNHPAATPSTPASAGVLMHPSAVGDRAKAGIAEADQTQPSTAPDGIADELE